MTEHNRLYQQEDRKHVSITVFFPCYNEQENVEKTTLKAVRLLEKIKADYEIISLMTAVPTTHQRSPIAWLRRIRGLK